MIYIPKDLGWAINIITTFRWVGWGPGATPFWFGGPVVHWPMVRLSQSLKDRVVWPLPNGRNDDPLSSWTNTPGWTGENFPLQTYHRWFVKQRKILWIVVFGWWTLSQGCSKPVAIGEFRHSMKNKQFCCQSLNGPKSDVCECTTGFLQLHLSCCVRPVVFLGYVLWQLVLKPDFFH